MRRLLCTLVLLGMVGACAPTDTDDGRIRVVASFYVLAEIAERVGEDLVEVTNLTPAGVEPHDVELTADARDQIEDADVVLHVRGGFQPAVDAAVDARDAGGADIGRRVGLARDDPHFWLDPRRMEQAVIAVRDALGAAEPAQKQRFEENASAFVAELRRLDERFAASMAQCARRDLVTAHGAFGYLAERYNLVEHSIAGVDPESEPSAARLAELAQLVRDRNVTTVFYESLVPRDFADTLAKEANVRTAVLNPLEGLTKAELANDEDYVSVMGRNRLALVAALGCSAA